MNLCAQVVVESDPRLLPLGRIPPGGRDDARIAACRAEIHLHEAAPVGLAVDVQLEDCLVLLLAERNRIPQEDEMAAFVQVQHHRESVVARHGGGGLHDARTVAGHLGDVTREVVPQQGVVEPARVLVRIEKVGALHLRAVAMAAERPQAAGSGRPRRQFAVIVHPIQDVLPVRSAFELRQHPREPRLRQSLGREVTHDVPHEIERFRILAVQQTVQTVFHGGKRVSVPHKI